MKRKLKYQGMETYQVVEIMPQMAVQNATLDGVVIDVYINGSKLKRFYGPLMLSMLQPIYKEQVLRKIAQGEAKPGKAKTRPKIAIAEPQY